VWRPTASDSPIGMAGPLKGVASPSSVSAWHRCAPCPPIGGTGAGLGATDRWAAGLNFPTHK
jgi:hypothetical protein